MEKSFIALKMNSNQREEFINMWRKVRFTRWERFILCIKRIGKRLYNRIKFQGGKK